MTESEPHVLCISFFDNGPVHMLSTIHEDAKFVTIHRRRWDGTAMKVVKIPIDRLEVRTFEIEQEKAEAEKEAREQQQRAEEGEADGSPTRWRISSSASRSFTATA